MKDEEKTREQLIAEIAELRRRVAEMEKSEIEYEQTERKLRQSEERYRSFFKTSKDCVFITSKDGRWIDMNDAAVELFGYASRAELQEVRSPDLYANPEDRAPHIHLIEESGFLKEYPVDLRKKDGSIIHALITSVTVKDDMGNVIGFQGTIRDITEQKRAEEALRESEEKYRILAEESPLAVSLIGKDGRYKYLNPKFTEIFGYTLEDIPTGRKWFRKAYPDEEYRKQCIASWKDDQKKYGIGEARPRKYIVTCKDGSKKTINFRSVTLETGDQLVIYEDVTETERLEERLRQAQKMESIGRLAGGVAHDFNNLLTTIMGNAEMALLDLGKDEPFYKIMEDIKGAGERAAQLTRQLLAFSRRQVLKPKVLDLNEVVREMHKMLVRLISEDIKLETILAPDLGRIEADPGQVEQIIMNLAVNARDAMPRGGKLTIETANVRLDETYAKRHGDLVTPGPYVMLAVSDTGVGMSPETRAQVFDPFFTTKEKGEGTGLGLSTVYGIVKQSNGYIWVYSEPGEGTTFKIYLPRVEKAIPKRQETKKGPEDLYGSETVLVVEDDEAVREIALQVLTRYGYTALNAGNGEEALSLLKEHKGEVHLLLTDVVMPGMSGRELATEIKRQHQALKVVYMSGYTDNAIHRNGFLEEGIPFIQKPFTPDFLARKVREVLDSD